MKADDGMEFITKHLQATGSRDTEQLVSVAPVPIVAIDVRAR